MSYKSEFHQKNIDHFIIENDWIPFFLLLCILEDKLTLRQLKIVLYRYQDFTFKEIAKKLGVSQSTIALEMNKIKNKLKKIKVLK